MVDDLDPSKGAFYQGCIDAVELERLFAPKAAVIKGEAENIEDGLLRLVMARVFVLLVN